jgi:hypothetical protein
LHSNIHLERVPSLQSSQHGWRHEVFFDLFKSFLLFCPPGELLMFEPNQWQQRLHLPCKVRYKMTQVIYLAKQLLDVFLAHRFSNLPDGLNFLRVNLYAMFTYYKPQEPSRCYSKGAHQWVHLQVHTSSSFPMTILSWSCGPRTQLT